MDISRIAILLACGLCLSPVQAQMYKWVDDKGNVSFSDRPPPSGETGGRASARVNTVTSSGQGEILEGNARVVLAYGNITLNVRKLFQQQRFQELNTLLQGYQAAVEKNYDNEQFLYTAYFAFDVNVPAYEPLLNAWVAATPDKYQPYLARAMFLYRMGGEARGSKWASETSREQFAAMNEYFARAQKDLDVVLGIERKVMLSYSLLIGMLSTNAEHERMYQVLQTALAINPASFNVRSAYLSTLTPRWGGSFDAMQAFIAESQLSLALNPRLKLLQGRIHMEAADMAALGDRYSEAEKRYTQALPYGDNHTVYFGLGKYRYYQEKYPQALRDMSRAIELYPEDGQYFYWRSMIYMQLGELDKAIIDVERAKVLGPGEERYGAQRDRLISAYARKGYDEYQAHNPEAAVATFSKVMRLSPADPRLYHWRARAYIGINDFDAALADVKQAIGLNPDDYDSYLLFDWLKARQGEWEQIIAYWDGYIARNPDNSRAYVERAGAYYRKGDIQEAVKNAKVAADMGNEVGKETYKKYQSEEL